MDTQQLAQVVCNVFSLGTPVAEPQVITEGLLHCMWRLETTQATFAVKELNPEIMSRPTARKNYALDNASCFELVGDFSSCPWIAILAGLCDTSLWQDMFAISTTVFFA